MSIKLDYTARFALLANDGTYVTVDEQGKLVSGATSVGELETFTFYLVDAFAYLAAGNGCWVSRHNETVLATSDVMSEDPPAAASLQSEDGAQLRRGTFSAGDTLIVCVADPSEGEEGQANAAYGYVPCWKLDDQGRILATGDYGYSASGHPASEVFTFEPVMDYFQPAEDGGVVNLSGVVLRDLSSTDLAPADLSKALLDGADLSGSDLSGKSLERASLVATVLDGTKLGSANLVGADLSVALLAGAVLSGQDLTQVILAPDADLSGANLSGCMLDGVDLSAATLTNTSFVSASLDGTDLSNADFSGGGTDFTGCDLQSLLFEAEILIWGIAENRTVFAGATLPLALIGEKNWNNLDLSGAVILDLPASFTDFSATHADLSGLNLAGKLLSYCDLTGAVIQSSDLSGCFLSNVSMVDADLSDTTLAGATLTAVDMSGATAVATDLSGATIDHLIAVSADLNKAKLKGSTLISPDLTGANLQGGHHAGVVLSGTVLLTDADLRRADFSGVDFTGVALRDATRLEKVVLSGCVLDDQDFNGCGLTGADLSEATCITRIDFSGAVLNGADLSGAQFAGATFASAQLGATEDDDSADLSEGTFPQADFTNATMDGVAAQYGDFTGATFTGATLTETLFIGANFTDATLQGAVLGGDSTSVAANLSYAFFQNTIISSPSGQSNLLGVDFSYATFLSGVQLDDTTTMAMTRFNNAYVTGTSFIGALLKGASFDGACLIECDFTQADLRPSDGTPATLTGSCLQGAIFEGALLDSASFVGATISFEETDVDTSYYKADGSVSIAYPYQCPVTSGLQDAVTADTVCPNGDLYGSSSGDDEDRFTEAFTLQNPATSWMPPGSTSTGDAGDAARVDTATPSEEGVASAEEVDRPRRLRPLARLAQLRRLRMRGLAGD